MLVAEKGIGGIYRGLLAVTMRQGANSAVRMGSYNTIKEIIQSRPNRDTAQPLSFAGSFGVGAIAGVITVSVSRTLQALLTLLDTRPCPLILSKLACKV